MKKTAGNSCPGRDSKTLSIPRRGKETSAPNLERGALPRFLQIPIERRAATNRGLAYVEKGWGAVGPETDRKGVGSPIGRHLLPRKSLQGSLRTTQPPRILDAVSKKSSSRSGMNESSEKELLDAFPKGVKGLAPELVLETPH